MEKRTILAIVLSLAVLLGFQYFFPPAHPPQKSRTASQTKMQKADSPPAVEKTATARDAAAEKTVAETRTPPPVAKKGELIVVDSPLYRAEIDTLGGCLKAFHLKKYKTENTPDSPLLNLVTVPEGGPYPLTGAAKIDTVWQPDAGLLFTVDANSRKLDLDNSPAVLKLTAPLSQGDYLVKELHFDPQTYVVEIAYSYVDPAGKLIPVSGIRVDWVHSSHNQKKSRYVYNGVIGYVNDKVFKPGKKDREIKHQEVAGNISWFGYTSKYFISALIPPDAATATRARGVIDRADADDYTVSLQISQANRIKAYIGPKKGDLLQALGVHLEASIEYGWFGVIARPLVWLLHFFYQYVHNYGVAIIILTILIKLAFYPLSQKSYKSMSQMKKIQPKLAKLKEKYKDDKARLNKEMMDLYRTHKVNPFGGCLPMVVQIPVFFALYRALMVAIELRHAPFVFWITDLSAKDPYYVTPLVMGATMFLQQKMTPTTGDAMQAKMMLFMPIVFTFMFLNFPSGLVLYWLVNNILSIGQQYLVMRQVETA
ncbi:MAG: membrane protein insertase YidC [Deltaproteobacteria bacterium]|nr:membrane protein insertase YidC [Deltaproteobacteria bacterium]